MKTTLKELPNSRVEVEAEVPATDVEKATSRTARAMAKEMRMPGFRAGKAPPSLVIQRLGFGPVLQEAIRDALPEWYEAALFDAGVSPIGDPSIEMVSTPEDEGQPLQFKFQVGVRPPAQLGDYKGLEVGKAEQEVPDEIVDTEVERVREGFARLEQVERAAAEGDSLLIDFEGFVDGSAFQGGAAEDYLLALGSNQLIEGFEEQLVGASAGEEREVNVTFPTDYQAEHLAGEDAVFKVKVKEVREKVLPELDDDFAADASEFDTLEELRDDIREKVGAALGSRAEEDFRMAAIDAAVAEANVEVPEELATARATERWERMERQLAQRGMDPNQFLQMQGKSREELIEETREDAEKELKREAVVTAIAEAEAIEVSDEEMVEALEHSAEHERISPEKLLERLRQSGRDALIREDLQARKAIELVAEAAKPIPKEEADARIEKAEAREKLLAPEGEGEDKAKAGGLWTPGD
ncbi:MAG TPA: trigger factor [Solirubrobacterales bacterium]|jgi:trigger factor|nr:trigger factor [Solirubrobacterales bacterium]